MKTGRIECAVPHGACVYVVQAGGTYNFAMPIRNFIFLVLLLTPPSARLAGQQDSSPDGLSLSRSDLPKASLWEPYQFQLEASGGTEPYRWQMIDSSLPKEISVNDRGEVSGTFEESGSFGFVMTVTDSGRPAKKRQKGFVIETEVPLTADWKQKTQVSGQRIDGSVIVSNRTGRDFDLTFIVLAVNDIGRATAIGYQHFPLKRDTQEQELPFGDTLSAGNYTVNVDVVGEEPISKRIFRARLVSGRHSIASAP